MSEPPTTTTTSTTTAPITPASTHPRDASPNRCIACRYDITTLDVDGRCPECGLPVRESVGPRRAWTVRRIGLARRMLASLIALSIASLFALPLGLLLPVFDSDVQWLVMSNSSVVIGVVQGITLLVCMIVALIIVARGGRRDEGKLHVVVPALVVGAVLLIVAMILFAIALDFGDATFAGDLGIWPIVVVSAVPRVAFAMMVLAPLVVARSMAMGGTFPGVRRSPIRLAIASVFVSMVAAVFGSLEIVAMYHELDTPESGLASVIRQLIGWLGVVSFAAWCLILFAAIHVRRAASSRLAEIERARSSATSEPS